MAKINVSATTVFWPPDSCFIDWVSPCPVNETYPKTNTINNQLKANKNNWHRIFTMNTCEMNINKRNNTTHTRKPISMENSLQIREKWHWYKQSYLDFHTNILFNSTLRIMRWILIVITITRFTILFKWKPVLTTKLTAYDIYTAISMINK